MKTIEYLTLVASIVLFAGCASMPPKELVNARSAYQQASEGPAAQLVPAELHKAHEALVLAEKSFQKEPDSYKTKDLAYVAQRKAEQAGALGAMAVDVTKKENANVAFHEKQTTIMEQGKQDLRAAEKQAAAQDLRDSEQRTADALAKLATLAAMKEEKRGLVLTLSGNVLFRSNEAILMSSAQKKLDQVANALLEVGARNLIVEGHTDSQGTVAYNQALSQRRAEAVRDYLISRKYPSNSIVAKGMGEASPIADNASAEGRANNRRVEIIIKSDVKATN